MPEITHPDPSGTPVARPDAGHRPDTSRRSWHRTASRPVSIWLTLLIVVGIAAHWVPQSRWLLVHMVTLGVATTSILVWGQYFTEAILHTKLGPADRRRQVARIWSLQAGILACCLGMVESWPWVVVAGATVVALAMAWYAIDLGRQVHHALPGRFDATVRFYCAAACLLPVGASLGAIMAFSPTEPWRSRLLLAHQGLNLLGFVGMTVVGTLVTLWPTVLRTPMEPRQDRHGRVALWILVGAVVATTAGALAGWWWLGAIGVMAQIVGVCVIGADLVACALRKPPRDYPGYAMGAAVVWFGVWLLWLEWTILTRRSGLIADDLTALSVPVIVGFLLQLLLGAMSYLMPMVMGGGSSIVRVTNAQMHAFGALRAVLTNAGLLIWVLGTGSAMRTAGMVLAAVGLAGFLPATFAMVRVGVPLLKERGRQLAARQAGSASDADRAASAEATAAQSTAARAPGTRVTAAPSTAARPAPAKPSPAGTAPSGRRTFVESVAGLGAALGAVAVGRALDGPAATSGSGSGVVAPTGHTTRVAVTMHDMRFHPGTIDVPAGDRLVVALTNTDPTQVHDLQFASGAHSPRLSPGQHATVDAGVISAPTQGWCTIVGHRSMGMVLQVDVNGTSSTTTSTTTSNPRRHIDLTRAPGSGFVTRDAVLPTLLPGRTHPLTLTVREAVQEVAPGATMRAMTYDGRVMGPVIHARIGDTMKVHLVNDGSMGHSIDFHAGMVSPTPNMRTIAPGQALDYEFTLNHAGIWLYHCSTMPMSAHIAAGMFGALVVPPRDLPSVDRQYVLVQSEAYLAAANGKEVDTDKIANETPDLTMFNGHANQYVFAPLKARVGERVRIWVLAAGPSRGISFHVVGTQFDTVFKEGAYLLRRDNPEGGGAQALDLASCQGGFVEMTFTEPGRYTFVNHSFVEMERGARGFIEVTS